MEKILADYHDSVQLNSSLLDVYSRKIRWEDKKEPTGIFFKIKVSSGIDVLYENEIEITKEFSSYSRLKHQQVVREIGRCSSVGDVSTGLENIF